ncbi:ion channel [Roseivirga ehrenbergii]|uniref:Potassium channel domain-containing protein n=1 Tax=Roseivirga ehrenbergii (strain DSM 102268 / JCM 13514 / KCTC 12282 / NCIMB 14502 / KMM 6017) TaxID=279360 RepID=A0A150XN62_ROSEK|nr:potassium channel family protein [Roseivirga ehrenbergii]KYG80197.1 hypothetical protein MB14_16790 [Roseivirga ehrenbergii]TCK99228.1 ion channel [Roseivirga ehrenbergii]
MIILRTILSFLRDKHYRNLLFATITVLVIGTVTYHYLEQWTWLDSLYFSIITLTTVGYGDFSPQTDWGKIFTIIYIVIGVGLILTFINTVYTHFKNIPQDHFHHKN